jgi:large subunit ribosomal protein L6
MNAPTANVPDRDSTGSESRLGKRPVPVPKGITVQIQGQVVTVKGAKSEQTRTFRPEVTVRQSGDELIVGIAAGNPKGGKQYQGLTRSLLRNMVVGASEGFKKSLDLRGVGYRAKISGDQLDMALGLSHGVNMTIPSIVTVKSEIIDEVGMKFPRLHLESHDNEILGQFAARIRSKRPPEPYKGKGVRYTGERIREKAGKAGKAGK